MIADNHRPQPTAGSLAEHLHDEGLFCRSIVDFIERELPDWKAHEDFPVTRNEPAYNEFLVNYLNVAARSRLDLIQFCHEPGQRGGRRADASATPIQRILVEDKRRRLGEVILPIECKRIPTPKQRNEIEYVIGDGQGNKRSGAIQRFKHGDHGHRNRYGLLIGYVEQQGYAHWHQAINQRLLELSETNFDESLWKGPEQLHTESRQNSKVHRLSSKHRRKQPPANSGEINLFHLWIQLS